MKFSFGNFPVNESIEFISGDSLCSITSYSMDDVLELFIRVAVLELFIDVSHIIKVKFTFAMSVQKGKVISSSILRKRRSLNFIDILRL